MATGEHGTPGRLGFVFWILVAHVFTAPEVGRATSLLSATTLIGYVALLGLNTTLVRYLPTSDHRDTLITVGLLLVGSFGALLSLGYAFAAPVFASSIAFLAHRRLFVVGFALMAAGSAINLVTDSIFIAYRRAGVNALVDGGIGGAIELPPHPGRRRFWRLRPVLRVGRRIRRCCCRQRHPDLVHVARPARLRESVAVMRPLLRFSAANYLAGIFALGRRSSCLSSSWPAWAPRPPLITTWLTSWPTSSLLRGTPCARASSPKEDTKRRT